MMSSNLTASRDAYQQNAILSASSAQLVVMLYDGARRFLGQASTALRERDIETMHRRLRRAEAIIGHLDATLDMSQGAIAERLHAIYVFCARHLNQARIDADPRKIDEVNRLLTELRESWATIAEA